MRGDGPERRCEPLTAPSSWPVVADALEDNLQRELPDPRILGCLNAAEACARNGVARIVKVHAVEEVKELRAKLQPVPFLSERHILKQTAVVAQQARTAQHALAKRSVRAHSRQREGRRVEVVDAGSALAASARTIRAVANRNATVPAETCARLVLTCQNRQRTARLGRQQSRITAIRLPYSVAAPEHASDAEGPTRRR